MISMSQKMALKCSERLIEMCNLENKIAIVTGAGGAICGEVAAALAQEGVEVAILDLSLDAAKRKAQEIAAAGGSAIAVQCDVTDKESVTAAVASVLAAYGTVDILINGAGGSRKESTTSPDLKFFDIDTQSLMSTVALNYISAVVPSQVVGRIFAEKEAGTILNISSIAGTCPLTCAVGYSSGKAALNNFTQWLAVHMAQSYSPKIRVNAIAPGFMLTQQNRFLLVDEQTGEMTERAKRVLANVPMGRYGCPQEIVGAALWLVSDAASFVTGAVVPVDGGFTAFSGV
jgi:NAD(P)-dependent dehydrogenase (short-subunit alcohol dehydrogenase family)